MQHMEYTSQVMRKYLAVLCIAFIVVVTVVVAYHHHADGADHSDCVMCNAQHNPVAQENAVVLFHECLTGTSVPEEAPFFLPNPNVFPGDPRSPPTIVL